MKLKLIKPVLRTAGILLVISQLFAGMLFFVLGLDRRCRIAGLAQKSGAIANVHDDADQGHEGASCWIDPTRST